MINCCHVISQRMFPPQKLCPFFSNLILMKFSFDVLWRGNGVLFSSSFLLPSSSNHRLGSLFIGPCRRGRQGPERRLLFPWRPATFKTNRRRPRFLFVLQQVDEWLNEVNCSFLQQVYSHLVLTSFFFTEIFICKFLTLIVCGRSI